MKSLKPYLIFSGNCEEALTFYSACLNGEITMLHRFADSPLDVPEESKEKVFNSEFRAESVRFMASDNLPPYSTTVGTNFALFIAFSDEQEQESVFAKLSEGGKTLMPLNRGFGMLEDTYGVRWMLALAG